MIYELVQVMADESYEHMGDYANKADAIRALRNAGDVASPVATASADPGEVAHLNYAGSSDPDGGHYEDSFCMELPSGNITELASDGHWYLVN